MIIKLTWWMNKSSTSKEGSTPWPKNSYEERLCLHSNKDHPSRGPAVKTRSCGKLNASKKSCCSNKSDNFKTRAIEEKTKLVELPAEESLLIKQEVPEKKAEKLKVQHDIAKTTNTELKIFETSAVDGKRDEDSAIQC